MSDIAVTWAKAQVCLGKNGKPDRNAKQVLVHMASYADAAGEAWALVSVLAMEMEVLERTVERGRQALVRAGLLIKTGQNKLYAGKLIPIYRLPLDEGHASTVRRLKAERETGQMLGATQVTPLGATQVTPQDHAPDAWGDTGDTPRGVTGDTQIGNTTGKIEGLTPFTGARACEAAQRTWAAKAPERVSPARVEASWTEAKRRSGETDDRLLAAVTACVRRDPDFGRGKAMNLDRWLDEGRFSPWLEMAETDPTTGAAAWDGPEPVRAVVAEAMGVGAVAAYVDPSGWDAAGQAIVTRTGIAADRLKRGAGRALRAIGVSVRVQEAAHVGG